MTPTTNPDNIRFAVPKGRMNAGVTRLLEDAGIRLRVSDRGYRPSVSLEGYETKILKPQAIIEMLDLGARDLGFAGADWVAERNADLVELVDTGLDRVRLVAAAPESIMREGRLPDRRLVVASEYVRVATEWIRSSALDASILHSYGATEVLPPEDADCIIDNTATGSTLRANDLQIVDEIMTSTTRLYASRAAMGDPSKRERVETLVMLVESVLEARRRVMLEVNVPRESLERVVRVLPCMSKPTISTLHENAGYALKAAVPRDGLTTVIPLIKSNGGRDIIVTSTEQIVP